MSNNQTWSEADYGLQTTANPNRELTKDVDGITYYRYPVRTNLVQLGDSYLETIAMHAKKHLQAGDILVCSEKFIGICQKRVVHESEINETWLAKLIAKFVVKYPDDIGWENPKKVQVAIEEVGYPRTIWAVIFGGIMKFVFRQPGWYYKIMGRDVAAIDGFNPIAISPFNEYAMLAPANPDLVSNEVASKFDVEAAVVDASNITTHILGKSDNLSVSEEKLIEMLDGNPMGQSREQTPLIIVRKK